MKKKGKGENSLGFQFLIGTVRNPPPQRLLCNQLFNNFNSS